MKMNNISYEIKKFIDRFNIERYLNQEKLEYRDASTGGKEQYVLHTCPHCDSINSKGHFKSWKLYIGRENKEFICYLCGQQGSLIRFLSIVEHRNIKEIIERYLTKDFFESLPKILISQIEELDQTKTQHNILREIQLPAEFEDPFVRPQAKFKEVYQYCIDRKITRSDGALDRKLLQDLDARYVDHCEYVTPSGKTHMINKRLIFPISNEKWGEDKVYYGFQGRDISGTSPIKYYISEGFAKTEIIYNYGQVFEADTITICEGIIDLIKCWDFSPICLFGKFISPKQMAMLHQMPNLKRIILALDPDTRIPDKHGNIPYNKLRDILKDFWQIFEIDLPNNQDAGSYTRTEMNHILSKAKPLKSEGLLSLLD